MTQHTQGPWHIAPTELHSGVCIKPIPGLVVADIMETTDEYMANARLIAAAPELLAAAMEACDLLADFDESLEQEGEVYKSLVLAIKKAKGA